LGNREAGPAMPIPFYVSTGGSFRPVPSSGRTVVRWIYPLPPDPPRFPKRDESAKESSAKGSDAGK
jgi:hypothetical protein